MDAATILGHLQAVDALRQAQQADAGRLAALQWVKDYQARRFKRLYAEQLAGGRYQAAARFFITELYGPQDMRQRDAQFARIVPTLERVFPAPLLATVARLTELHALSEDLDDRMAQALCAAMPPRAPKAKPAQTLPATEAGRYVQAWQACGQPDAREHQIALTLSLVQALEHHTRSRLLRLGLRTMRAPAQAAGLGALQHFLETGFDTFGGLGDTAEFQRLIAGRERDLSAALFSPIAARWDGQAPVPLPALASLP